MLAMACGGTAPTTPAATKATGTPITVGFQAGLTGSVSADPISELDGFKAYFNYLNNRGGVDNHPVDVVARDDTGLDAAKAKANFIEFRDKLKVPVIAGWTVSNVSDAVLPDAQAAQIPLIIGTGTEKSLANPYAYMMDTLFSQEAIAEINFLKTLVKPGDKPKIALFAATSAAGRTLDAQAKQMISDNGWNLVIDEAISVSPVPPDMVPQANKVVAAKADYVVGGIFLSLPVSFMRTLAQAGWKGKVINFRGGSGINYLQQINDPNYYVVRSFAYAQDSKTMVDAVKAIGGDPTGNTVAGGWLAAEVIAKALKTCGFPCTGPNMKKALDSLAPFTPEAGAFGKIGYTATDHIGIHAEQIYVWKDGKPVTVGSPVAITNPVQTPSA